MSALATSDPGPMARLEAVKNDESVPSVIFQRLTDGDEPERLNASRVKRIAKGSGRSEKDVRELLSRYKQMKTMVKSSKGRELRQMMRRMGGQ